jgi:hypothetical protein
LQTAIDGGRRQDRFVAELETNVEQLVVRLPKPAFARNPTPKFLLNGQLLRAPDVSYVSADDSFVVRLPARDASKRHTLELFYSVNSSLSNWTSLEIQPPLIEGAEHVGRFYWQLVTPQTTHLAGCPPQLTAEWQWHWGGLWWFRESARDERELDEWLNAYEAETLPASCNRYLMSGQFPQDEFHGLVISRLLLWFPVGCVAIAVATLVLNVRAVRKPIFGLLLAGFIATLAVTLPDLGVLLGQTAVISLGLAALVFATQAAIDSRIRRRSVFSGRYSTVSGSSVFSITRVSAQVKSVEPKVQLQVEQPVTAQGGK